MLFEDEFTPIDVEPTIPPVEEPKFDVEKPILDNEKPIIIEPTSIYDSVPVEKKKKTRKPFWNGFLGGLLAWLLLTAVFGGTPSFNLPFTKTTNKTANQQISKANGQELSVIDISKKAGPAVVGITTKTQFSSFFGSVQETEGSGSGFIIRQDGYIVTNNHVIDGASTMKVITNTGKEYNARLIGKDAKTDLAVVKIDASGLPTVELGKSAELEVGEIAVAIGNPLGQDLAGSVTVGFISALNRVMTVENTKYTLIQTDAAINPGNSGGPLLNTYGQVIGINTVKVSSAEGLGFAIPIDNAKTIIDDLIANGYVKGRPVIGFTPRRDITSELSKYYGIPAGIYVGEVQAFSGAEDAGLKTGDIIVAFNGKKCLTYDELEKMKEGLKPGDIVNIKVKRANDSGKWGDKELKIKLKEEKASKN
ncbi:S1C family serine protease [Treponema sp. R6D11]